MKEVSQDVFLRPQVLKTGFCSRDVFVQGCWRGTRAPLLLSPPDTPRRAALLFREALGPCRHARSSTQGWGQCPWPAISPEPSVLPKRCLTVVTRMKEQP